MWSALYNADLTISSVDIIKALSDPIWSSRAQSQCMDELRAVSKTMVDLNKKLEIQLVALGDRQDLTEASLASWIPPLHVVSASRVITGTKSDDAADAV